MRVRVNDSELEVDCHGSIGATGVVLIADADTAAVRWSPLLLRLLVDAGFCVLTFDHRDTASSATATAPYLLRDMADDVAEVVAAFDLREVGLVGMGMGGTIALHAALRHPQMVRSLVVLGATPGRSDDRLPEPTPNLVEAMVARAWAGPPEDREDRISSLLELAELLAGTRYVFDEVAEFGRVVEQVDQELQAEATAGTRRESGHGHAVVESESLLDDLPKVSQSVLVVHGDADPVYPLGHGEAIADAVPAAQLLVVSGLGHEAPDGLIAEYGTRIVEALSVST